MHSIRQKLVLNYVIILFIAVLILQLLFIFTVHQYYLGTIEQTLKSKAGISKDFYNSYLEYYSLEEKARYIFENTNTEDSVRTEVIDLDHKVILDTTGFISDKTVNTTDIDTAIAGKIGIWRGKHEGSDERVMAVSTPLYTGNKVAGVLRYTTSLEKVYDLLSKIFMITIVVGLLVIILSLIFSLLLARSIINPIQELTLVAEQMAHGNYTVKACKRNNDEIGKLADTFNFMAEEIGKTEKMKNEFISSISHELRTPLTSIKGWSETILSGNLQDTDETMEGLKIISRESDRLTGLVEELLDFSRFESGRVTINTVDIDINSLIEEVVNQFRLRAEEKDILLEIEKDEKITTITGDKNRLKQVLINILDNALKFTEKSGYIKVISRQKKKGIEIEVIDNGIGISNEDLPQITQRFYRGNLSYPGSGLGLSICKEIINMHKGTIKIGSKPGEGTSVKIFIPQTDTQ